MNGEDLANGIMFYPGQMREVLAQLPENSIDSCVCDPPYHLTSIVRRFGADGAKEVKTGAYGGGFDPKGNGTGAAFARMSKGFMGKQWDGGDIAFDPETWAHVYRVLKPGGHLLAFGAPKNFGFMQVAIANAGFEIRDVLAWMFGSGFPKSHDVSKGIDRAAGAKREVVGIKSYPREGTTPVTRKATSIYSQGGGENVGQNSNTITAPATPAARQWQGWGTALKPAYEPIIMARKPLSEGTVAANVLEHGTGAINVDGCRVPGIKPQVTQGINSNATSFNVTKEHRISGDPSEGRWPANVVHDGSDEVVGAFPDSAAGVDNGERGTGGIWGASSGVPCGPQYGDSGSAARFFYTAKADSDDRLGSKHPTVKPLDLMQWLVRLVTPKGGTVLDCFAGTGTTGEAAFREGMRAVLIEAESEHGADIRRRMALMLAGPDERLYARIKASGKAESPGPLFDFDPLDDIRKSVAVGFEAVRERKASGGPGWSQTDEQ